MSRRQLVPELRALPQLSWCRATRDSVPADSVPQHSAGPLARLYDTTPGCHDCWVRSSPTSGRTCVVSLALQRPQQPHSHRLTERTRTPTVVYFGSRVTSGLQLYADFEMRAEQGSVTRWAWRV